MKNNFYGILKFLRVKRDNFFKKVKNNLPIIPLMLMIGVVPLIVHTVLYEPPSEVHPFGFMNTFVNQYTYAKSIAILLLDVMMLFYFLHYSRKQNVLTADKQMNIIFRGLLLFSLLAVISSVFSDYPITALWGSPGRDEGILILLSYTLVSLYAALVIRNESAIQCIKYALIFLSFLLSVLGIAKIFGKNLLMMAPLRYIVAPIGLSDIIIDKTNNAKDFLNLTLYNPNFVGSYCALMLPMLFVIFKDRKENRVVRIFSFILFGCTVVILFFSRSQAGMVGVMISFFIGLYYFVREIRLYQRKSLLIIVTMSIFFSLINFLMKGAVIENFIGIFKEGINVVSPIKDYKHDPTYGAYMYDIHFEDKCMTVKTKAGDFKISAKENSFEVQNPMNDSIRGNSYISEDNEELIRLLQPYSEISIKEEKNEEKNLYIFKLYHQDILKFIIVKNKEGEVYLSTPTYYPVELKEANHMKFFEGKENIASDRGYIWSRTIPMLKDTLFIGYGPDNYLMAFPQGDLLAKAYVNEGKPFLIVDKPHNMYLQWAVNEGVIALFSLLFSFGYYIIDSFKLYHRKLEYSSLEYFGIGVLMAVIGYLGTGFFNDSVVPVAPIFWTIFGVGIAINMMVRKSSKLLS